MTQNRSTAVMQRRVAGTDSLDFYPTPLWATRALCEWLLANDGLRRDMNAWDPACGEGHMTRALGEYFQAVTGSDIHDYGIGYAADFLFNWHIGPGVDWIITNPPFKLAERFATHAIKLSRTGCAILVRTAFLESKTRYRTLFEVTPPSNILQFTERVVMHHGKLSQFGSTATAYCWIIWRKGTPSGTHFHWIPPCRKKLERPGDYD